MLRRYPSLERLLVDDGIGVFSWLEQRRYPAHAFRVAETDVAAGRQTVIHRLDGLTPRFVVKVDQHVPAENDIDAAELIHELGIDDIALREIDGTANVI